MKIKIKIEKEFEAKYIHASVGARYWEDATVNGVEDTDGTLIPCRVGDIWKPIILIDSGKIINWKQGTTADIHYKSCDNNTFKLLDENEEEIVSIEGYVIDTMCPEKEGYGDYVIMKVDENGFIANWQPNMDDFIENED